MPIMLPVLSFPARPVALAVADTRVETCVEQIGEQIRCCVDERDQHGDALQQWDVAVLHRFEQQLADAGVAEHVLDDNQAADEPATFKAITVIAGSRAFRSACLTTTVRQRRPLSTAVRM